MPTPTQPLSRRSRKKAETKERIFDAAMSLLSDQDFDDVTIDQICERADVANATFFLHFSTKASLFDEFSDRVNAAIANELRDHPGTAIEKMELVHQVISSRWRPFPARFFALVHTFVHEDPAEKSSPTSERELVSIISDIVETGQRKGEFDAGFDPQLVATSLISAWNAAFLTQSKHNGARLESDAHADVLRIILQGIKSRPSSD